MILEVLETALRVASFFIFGLVAFWLQDNATALGDSPARHCIPGRKEEEQALIPGCTLQELVGFPCSYLA